MCFCFYNYSKTLNKQHKNHSFYCNKSVISAGKILLFLADKIIYDKNDFFYHLDLWNFIVFSVFCK